MNHYLFDRDGYHKFFNCTYYDVDMVPANERKDPIFGIFMICSSVFFELCHIPVLIILWTPAFQKESCYKLMSVIAAIDIIALSINGLLTGVFSILGIVYCSCPQFMLLAGFAGYAAWLAESDLAVTLAFNRCLFMLFPKTCNDFFKNGKVYFWVVGAISHALITALVTGPLTYNSIYGVWLFNPHFGYPQPDFQFGNFWHPIHNTCIPMALAFFYILFIVTILKKTRHHDHSQHHSRSQKGVFLQVFIIALLHFVIALLYLYEQYFPIPAFLTRFSQAGWMCIHGAPCVVYLTMNKSVQKRALEMFGCEFNAATGPSQVSTITVHSAGRKKSNFTGEESFAI